MCDEIHAAGLGTKKHGMPCMTVARLAEAFGSRVQRPMKSWLAPCSTRDQNSRNRSMRFSGAFPAIKAALIAPMEVPITQSGSIPASCIAS